MFRNADIEFDSTNVIKKKYIVLEYSYDKARRRQTRTPHVTFRYCICSIYRTIAMSLIV